MKGETSSIRFSEAQKLLDYGFKNFEYSTFSTKGEMFKNIIVDKGTFPNVNAIFEDSSGTLIKKGNDKNVSTNIELNDKVPAPVTKDQVLGKITYLIDNKIVGTSNLVADSDVKKLTIPNMLARIFENWFMMLR